MKVVPLSGGGGGYLHTLNKTCYFLDNITKPFNVFANPCGAIKAICLKCMHRSTSISANYMLGKRYISEKTTNTECFSFSTIEHNMLQPFFQASPSWFCSGVQIHIHTLIFTKDSSYISSSLNSPFFSAKNVTVQ